MLMVIMGAAQFFATVLVNGARDYRPLDQAVEQACNMTRSCRPVKNGVKLVICIEKGARVHRGLVNRLTDPAIRNSEPLYVGVAYPRGGAVGGPAFQQGTQFEAFDHVIMRPVRDQRSIGIRADHQELSLKLA